MHTKCNGNMMGSHLHSIEGAEHRRVVEDAAAEATERLVDARRAEKREKTKQRKKR